MMRFDALSLSQGPYAYPKKHDYFTRIPKVGKSRLFYDLADAGLESGKAKDQGF